MEWGLFVVTVLFVAVLQIVLWRRIQDGDVGAPDAPLPGESSASAATRPGAQRPRRDPVSVLWHGERRRLPVLSRVHRDPVRVTRAVAINVGANTNQPGFRGPLRADGSFVYVPIPESEQTSERAPTYADLDLPLDVPADVRDTPVHLDPTFAEYPCCDRYTYGDPHGVKARPLLDLEAGDRVYFYATLNAPSEPAAWMAAEWGAYLIGEFTLAHDPVAGDDFADLPNAERERFAGNAHLKRDPFDAAVLLAGTDASRLYDHAVPLSGAGGVDANQAVTEWSKDSGRGPWWRRPLRYDHDGARRLEAWVERERYPPVR